MLRRHFLDKYHSAEGPLRVFDACQGDGDIWGTLRREWDVQYWGVDRVARRGRLAIDSVRVLAGLPSLPFEVVDIDTQGSPWRHWEVLLPKVDRPVTVFLSQGGAGGITQANAATLRALGIRFSRDVPKVLRTRFDQLGLSVGLAMCFDFGVDVVEAREVLPRQKRARYFGVRLVPARLSPVRAKPWDLQRLLELGG